MSQSFAQRLFPLLPQIMRDFKPLLVGEGTGLPEEMWALSPGAHIYDEQGIRETINRMQQLFFTRHPGTNFFAVKACPNLEILRIMLEMGFGLDCASPTELYRAKLVGAKPHQIMYTSNNTNPAFYPYALASGGIINLDDLSFVEKLPEMPKRICFRYNPGPRRQEGTDKIIGTPVNQKYGLRHDQIVEAYKMARDKGAEIFGIHTMYASNCRDPHILAGNAKMQLGVIEEVQDALGIQFEFLNIGGGLGINYKAEDEPLDIGLMAELVNTELDNFKAKHGYLPLFYIESGRFVTGPHGVLVARAINILDKYKKFIGLDVCDACDILRAPIYPAHHEVSILTPEGVEKIANGGGEKVSIVGPLCENMHMISDRELPEVDEGDFVVVHDTGAHGIAMKMGYNGWETSQELLLRSNDSVVRIGRAGTIGDILEKEILPPYHHKEVQY
jgi:diaminopimelate decarboxylase